MQPGTDAADPATICYGASDYRQLIAAVFQSPGVLGSGDWQITSSNTAAVNIGIGSAVVAGTSAAEQRSYLCRNAAIKAIQPPGPPNTNNRYDLICLTAHDGQILGDHLYEWQIQCLSGAEATSPTVPALPKDSIALAAILRKPATANIASGDISDLRAFALLPTQPQNLRYWKVEATSAGTSVSAAAPKIDNLPFLKLNVTDATKIYRVMFIGAFFVAANGSAGIAAIKDGGANNPVLASTSIATVYGPGTTGTNQTKTVSLFVDMTFSVGTHTLGLWTSINGGGSGHCDGATAFKKQLAVSLL
jgi:hypothetical protein